MQRLNKIITVLILSLMAQACGVGGPVVVDRSTELSAPMSVLEKDLPGCDALTAEMISGQDSSLLQHPASSDLVVFVVDHNRPVCVGTLAGIKGRLAELMGLKGEQLLGMLPDSDGEEGEGEGSDEGDGANDGDKSAGQLNHSVTIQGKTLVADDPIPIFLTTSTK